MKLSNIYRKYLKGKMLEGPLDVTIIALKQVEVSPLRNGEVVLKPCLWVTGLPKDTPNGILCGPAMIEHLVNIFGDIETEELQGKKLQLYPADVKVAGKQYRAIRFRAIQKPKAPPASDKPDIDPDPDLPF